MAKFAVLRENLDTTPETPASGCLLNRSRFIIILGKTLGGTGQVPLLRTNERRSKTSRQLRSGRSGQTWKAELNADSLLCFRRCSPDRVLLPDRCRPHPAGPLGRPRRRLPWTGVPH